MASVSISVDIYREDFHVALERPILRSELDALLDEAVARIKRAYHDAEEGGEHEAL